MRVMDDLADQQDAPVRELPARLVRIVDRALHPVAEAELVRQAHGEAGGRECMVPGAQELDQLPAVVRRQDALDLGLEAESLADVGILGGGHPRNLMWRPPPGAAARARGGALHSWCPRGRAAPSPAQ